MNYKILLVLISLLTVWGCKKEYSDESGDTSVRGYDESQQNSNHPLASLSCEGGKAYGEYLIGGSLNENNYIIVTLNFKTSGYYFVNSDTSNGVSFEMDQEGYNVGEGLIKIKMFGKGRPLAASTETRKIYVNKKSTCTFSLSVDSSSLYVSNGNDYLPLTVGSRITCDTIDDAYPRDTVIFKVLPQQRIINGTSYTQIASSRRGDTNFYNKNGQGQYFRYYKELNVAYKCLDEKIQEGGGWFSDQFRVDTPITLVGKIYCEIIKKNVRLTLSNISTTKKIDSVIMVRQTVYSKNNAGNFEPFAFLVPDSTYYAKNIGVVYYTNSQINIKYKARSWYIY